MCSPPPAAGHDRPEPRRRVRRADGTQSFKQSTIQNVVLDQIREAVAADADEPRQGPGRAGRRRLRRGGRRAWAARGDAAARLGTDGKKIFSANCASCHTLKAAGATGTIGPNLDQLKPALRGRAAPGRGRRRRHAGVQGQAQPGADRRGGEVRRRQRRQVGTRCSPARAARRRRGDRGGTRAHVAVGLRARLRRRAPRDEARRSARAWERLRLAERRRPRRRSSPRRRRPAIVGFVVTGPTGGRRTRRRALRDLRAAGGVGHRRRSRR